MMANKEQKLVRLIIDDVEYQVPEGMNLVDAAKLCGNDIPVFCYHPKLGHAANCRMCLVELGTPRPNRETGEMELAWFPGLVTACNQYVTDGMAIRTTTKRVEDGRREILEFLLSSHPLDCPICDKGGECPLQNLTMRHGPGTSRMYWEDRMRLGKHIPLGELIYLDQERCIHCARCIRFQEIIADDPVLSFDKRGRKQQIITHSEPGFDSIFSGNTTDICPVGALTTADFRFNARPWEMQQVATLDTHTPEGSNLYFDTRTDRLAGGRTTIKRVMPRQNEEVNEIWISDKARFVRHYMDHPDRLQMPLMRRGGKLVEATWDEALHEIASQLRTAGDQIAALGGGRLSNEDLFALQALVRSRGSHNLSPYPARVAGAQYVAQVGVGSGTNLLNVGAGDAILVVASDLHEEAPIWWLRVKAAAERGAALIVVNGRPTRLDKFATHVIRCAYGDEINTLNALAAGSGEGTLAAAAQAFRAAQNGIVFVGSEGLEADSSERLAQSAAHLLIATGHVGRPNNGLIVVWAAANGQGAADMGFSHRWLPGYAMLETPGLGYDAILNGLKQNDLKVVIIAGADPVFDDAAAEDALRSTNAFIVVQDMFLTATAELADVVLPTQSIAEREGTFTSGERRVQRFYPAIEPLGQSKPDWLIAQSIAQQLGGDAPLAAASLVFKAIASQVPQYAGMSYLKLAQVRPQMPDVGGEDLYYGGTAFTNRHGLGMQWPAAAEAEGAVLAIDPAPGDAPLQAGEGRLVIVPVTVLYDREPLAQKTELLEQRIPAPHMRLNPADARQLGISEGDLLGFEADGRAVTVSAVIDAGIPQGVAVTPRRLQPQGAPRAAVAAGVVKLEKIEA
ncbi:MAG: NADH-quinone oxidoreductase subunit NuoG [Anaerolineae bacterium]